MEMRITTATPIPPIIMNFFACDCSSISSPPVRFPDFYGIDTPKQSELIAAHKTVEQIRKFLGATSLHFLSLEGLVKSIGIPKNQLSISLFTGEYPIDLRERKSEVDYNVPKK